MMNENYNTPNSGCCGRPFPTAPENKCKYNDCCMNEYAYKQKACIRNKQPDCETQAVIPSITVETADGITNLANCLVHVTSTNTTYYVDDKHRILITWAGPVNIPGYDMQTNPNHYKNQIVTDTEAETAVIYDNNGKGYIFGITSEDLQTAVNNKLDEMAEDGTLGRIINEYLSINYIFPKYESETYSTWGDITLIEYNDKIICIDTGLDERWDEIHLMLLKLNIEHFDVLMISHWHNDHCSNLENMINSGYVDSETFVYIPGDVTHWADIVTAQTYYKTVLDNANIEYRTPSEGEQVDFYGVQIQFNNTENLDTLYDAGNDYNACSMVVSFKYKNHKSMFTGDATTSTLTHLYDLGVAKEKVDLYKIGHHGIAQEANKDFINAIHPNVGILIASPSDSNRSMNAYDEECAIIESYGGMIYPTFYQKDYMRFQSGGENVKCISGYPKNTASTTITNTIYVDASVDLGSYSDGTQDHPYKTIQQAIGSQPNYLDVLTINVADGTYIPIDTRSQKNIIKISGKHCGRIEIIGNTANPENVIVQAVNIENANVVIKGLTVKTDQSYYGQGIIANSSNVTLENVDIGDSSYDNSYSAITAIHTLLYMASCNLSYQRYAIILNNGCYGFFRNCTFDHIKTAFITGNNSSWANRGVTFTNSTPLYFPNRENQNDPVLLSNNNTDETFTSTIPLSNFTHIRVTWRTDDYDSGVIDIPVAPTARHYDVNQKFVSSDNTAIYEKCGRITVEPTANTVSISRKQLITTIKSSGDVSYTAPDHTIYFVKIEGILPKIS